MSFFGDAPAELLYAMPAIGGAVTGTVTTGSAAGGPMLAPSASPCELPHNYFSKIGKALLVEGGGVFTTGATAPTLKFGIALDSSVGVATASILCATGAFTTLASITGSFIFKVMITCTGLGTAGTLQPVGLLHWGSSTLTTTVGVPDYLMAPSSTTPVTFSTGQTTPVYVDPFAFWSTTSTGPSMTLTNFFLWGLN